MEHTSAISFPGLGIDVFSVKNSAFSIFGHPVMWYGIIICVGIILAFLYFSYRAGKAGIKFDDVIDMTLITVPSAIIGARLYYIIFYGNVHSFYDAIAIWNGGLAIYGAIIGGLIAIILVCRHKKLDVFKLTDMITPAVLIGQILGRWGNFCNGEAFGGLVTESSPLYFLRMGLQNSETMQKFGTSAMVYVHPTFLYESVWNLIGFVLINIFYKKKKYNGEILLWYFAWYGFGRMFIEQLRTDSLYIGNTGIRVSALLGLVCVAVTVPMLIILRVLYHKYVKAGTLSVNREISIPFFFGCGRNPAPEKPQEIEFNTEEFEKAESEKDDAAVKKAIKRKELFSEGDGNCESDGGEHKIKPPVFRKTDGQQAKPEDSEKEDTTDDKEENESGENN